VCDPSLLIPSNVRIEEDAIQGWVLRWNSSSPINQYQIQILNTQTNQSSETAQTGNIHQLTFQTEPDILYSLKVRAIIAFPMQYTNWSTPANFGIPLPCLDFEIIATFGNTLYDVKLPNYWSWSDYLTTDVGNVTTIPITFYATYKRMGGWIAIENIPLSFTILRATPIVKTPYAVLATEGDQLASIILPQRWSWNTPAVIVGEIGEREFYATYNKQDTNWNTITKPILTIVIKLPTPTATFGNTLVDVLNLPQGWKFDECQTTCVGDAGIRYHSATYTRDGFKPIKRILSVSVSRAIPDVETPTGLKAEIWDPLNRVVLPSNWTWDNQTILVGDIGLRSFAATYNNGDSNYFAITKNICIEVRGVKFEYVSAGVNHSLAIDIYGRLWAWGSNFNGRLGDGTLTARLRPTRIIETLNEGVLPQIKSVSASAFHSIALDIYGRVWAWGNNGGNELGDGTTTERHKPVRISQTLTDGALPQIKAVSAGSNQTVVLDIQGRVWAWGDGAQFYDGVRRNSPVRISQTMNEGNLPQIKFIEARTNHIFAIDVQKRLWAWGTNSDWRIPYGNTSWGNIYRPVRIAETMLGGEFPQIISVSAGWLHTTAVDIYGRVWAWGNNSWGSVGDGTTNQRSRPVLINETLNGDELPQMVFAYAGSSNTIVVDIYDRVWVWGNWGYFRWWCNNTNI